MNDCQEIVGLWASTSGLVIWLRPGRGRSVLASLAPAREQRAVDLVRRGRDKTTVIGSWDDYNWELRIPLPWLGHGAELTLGYEYPWTDENGVAYENGVGNGEQLTGGVSMDDVAAAKPESIPRWLLPSEPILRVPEASWSEYAIASSRKRSSAGRRRRSTGPQNNRMHLTRAAMVKRRGPRR